MINAVTIGKRTRLTIVIVLIAVFILGAATSMFINQPNDANANPIATPLPAKSSTVTPAPSPTSTPTPTSMPKPASTLPVYAPIAPVSSPQDPSLEGGLNYLSASNRFYQGDSITRNDFEFFKVNNINFVSIRIFWKSFAEDHDNLIKNYNRLLAVADYYNIRVQFDFWTQFGQSAPTPLFLTSTYDIIRNATAKQQWFSFVSEAMNEFKSHDSIESWTMMNEPYINEAADKELFYQCWTEQRELMKSIDSRPVSIRFALGSSPWSGDFDTIEVFKVCDYIAINEYLDPSNTSYSRWGSNWSMFDQCVTDCKTAGKPLIISEFGSDSGDDEAKRVWYEQSLSLFKSEGIRKAYAWAWQTANPEDERFNIAGPPPKPAFYELTSALPSNYFIR